MGTEKDGNGEIELLRDAVIAVVGMARNADSDKVKLAMDILLAGTSQLGTIFQQRCAQLAKPKQSRKAKPPKASPQRGPQQPKRPPSSTDTPKAQNAAQKRPEELSSIQRGIRQVVRSWFFAQDGGFYVQCKYGSKAIALSKDGNAIFVKQLSDVKPVLETLRSATENGELDAYVAMAIKVRKNRDKLP